MKIYEIRKKNLNTLIDIYGSIEKCCAATGLDASYVSQTRSGHRNIGNAFARRIEKSFGKNEGWLDIDHSAPHDFIPRHEEVCNIADAMTDNQYELWLNIGKTILAGP